MANSKDGKWQRLALAACAVILLMAGVLISNTNLLAIESKEFTSGTLMKVGFVLALCWIAAPQLQRFGWQKLRGTLLLAVIIVLILCVIRPRIGAIAAAVFVAGTLLMTVTGWLRRLGGKRR